MRLHEWLQAGDEWFSPIELKEWLRHVATAAAGSRRSECRAGLRPTDAQPAVKP